MSSARVRTSPPPAPGASCPTNAMPPMSSAPVDQLAGRGQQLLQPDLLDLLLGRAQALDDVVDALGQLLGTHLERLAELGDQHVLAGQEAVGVAAHQRLDPSYAGADRALAEQLDHAELAGALGVRAAAELAGPVADRDHAHLVAVLLPEQRHRPGPDGLVLGHHLRVHAEVARITRSLTRASTSCIAELGHRAGRGEVEAEPARASSPSPPASRSRRAPRGRPCAPCGSPVCDAADRRTPLDVDQRLRVARRRTPRRRARAPCARSGR